MVGQQRMTILNSGDVGIGTASPGADLHIADGTSTLKIESTTAANDAVATWTTTTQSWSLGIDESNSSALTFSSSTALGTPRMILAANGDVGIGSSTPLADLYVVGRSTVTEADGVGNGGYQQRIYKSSDYFLQNLYYTGNNTSGATQVFNHYKGSGIQLVDGDNIGVIDFNGVAGDGNSGTAAKIMGEIDGASSGNTDMPGRLTLWTTPDGTATALERMRIDSTGNVGIGTQTPTSKLVVNGAARNLAAISNGTSTVNFATGNIQYTTSNCGSFNLHNLKDGGSYTFIVQGTTSAECVFSAYSDAGSTSLTVHLPSGHGVTTAGEHTMYTILVAGTHAYFSWITEFD